MKQPGSRSGVEVMHESFKLRCGFDSICGLLNNDVLTRSTHVKYVGLKVTPCDKMYVVWDWSASYSDSLPGKTLSNMRRHTLCGFL